MATRKERGAVSLGLARPLCLAVTLLAFSRVARQRILLSIRLKMQFQHVINTGR